MKWKYQLIKAGLVFAALLLILQPARAQFDVPNPLAEMGLGVPYWQHVKGHASTTPCLHLETAHPNGHPTKLPCAHLKKQHPKGHDTGKISPCLHIKNGQPEHNGHKIYAPCLHMVKQHPNGHAGPTSPCLHKTPKHPKGHKGPNVPCNHYLKVKSQDNRLGLVFYTSDKAFVDNVKRAVSRLRTLGVEVGRPRKLHVFHRKPYNGKVSSDDPMWSHYNPAFHSIQVMQGIPSYQETTRHELGHAILGHQCIQILSLGGSHQLTKTSKPGVAMAEGWANFVGLVLTHQRTEAKPIFKGYDWEKGTTKDGNSAGKKSPNIEFRVGCTLWDLYDKPAKDDDDVAVPFSNLFRVYSPTLKTLRNSPVIPNLKGWIDRFKNNNPKIRVKVAKIVNENTM